MSINTPFIRGAHPAERAHAPLDRILAAPAHKFGTITRNRLILSYLPAPIFHCKGMLRALESPQIRSPY
ncbi:MAG: hypothetical protein LZF61_10215 [Nitrosomonas sp.]|nr:MAG: hypothetical protein LZF61_10215 [Nitrosomonas sp.]